MEPMPVNITPSEQADQVPTDGTAANVPADVPRRPARWFRAMMRALAVVTVAPPLYYLGPMVLVFGMQREALGMVAIASYLAALWIVISAKTIRPHMTLASEAAAVLALVGFRRPAPRRGPSRSLLLWCLVVPVALAVTHFGLERALAVIWQPGLDAAQAAANADRDEMFYRHNAFGAVVLLPFFVAALPEEITYRAPLLLIQNLTTSVRWRRASIALIVVAAVISTVLFAQAHSTYGPSNVVNAGIGGAMYAGLTLYTRSIWPAIICHGLFDALVVAVSLT
ncbi:CPBP family intramembrane glutamic endopeptidase [Nocardia tengchongensis]|uniref:CPBP family intramembrane glutamic endopeptidase n=1 Tax=Nocardia tengchongensis TaxID=2055889 RepID=UPI003615F628